MVAEVNDLCRTDEGKIKGVEEEQEPLALIVAEGNFFELVCAGDPGVGFEEGGCLSDDCPCSLAGHDISK